MRYNYAEFGGGYYVGNVNTFFSQFEVFLQNKAQNGGGVFSYLSGIPTISLDS